MEKSLAQTGTAIGDAMARAIYGARSAPAGTTVGDFLDALFQAGVNVDEPLSSIQYDATGGSIVVCRDEANGVVVQGGR